MKYVYAFLLLGATLQIATSQITPSITFISPKQVGEVGGSVNLKCTTKNAQDVPIGWTKDEGENTIYITVGSALIFSDNRYSIRQNQTTWTHTLQIRDLQLQDAGLYRCSLNVAGDNRHHADVELEVRQTPDSSNR